MGRTERHPLTDSPLQRISICLYFVLIPSWSSLSSAFYPLSAMSAPGTVTQTSWLFLNGRQPLWEGSSYSGQPSALKSEAKRQDEGKELVKLERWSRKTTE